jgi:formylglycine-generating enzyme required for sulfatase activity
MRFMRLTGLAGTAYLLSLIPWFPPALAQTQEPAATALSAVQERALKPKDTFQECSKCPVMMVVGAGSFVMGSPASEPERGADEGPQHKVTIANQFAVGQYQLTFDEWDSCVADGGCNGYNPSDFRWGRGRRPVIYVSWDDANAYVAWLAKKTGKPYQLLSEAEYEYATRAGTTTIYPWGNDVKLDGQAMANCDHCGGQWDGRETAPVGSFAANGFGLYDMVGNVWEWTQDCHNRTYNGAPTDGSAWTSGDCTFRVLRGGAVAAFPRNVRSANRSTITPPIFGDHGPIQSLRVNPVGFRVSRTLLKP